MNLSKNNLFIIDKLREKQLTKYIRPFKKMVELYKLGEIDIRPGTWGHIMKIFRDPFSDRADFEKCISSYLVHYGIFVVRYKRTDKTITKNRVKRYRTNKKRLGYKQVSIMLASSDFERLKNLRKKEGFTYSEAINYLLNCCKK